VDFRWHIFLQGGRNSLHIMTSSRASLRLAHVLAIFTYLIVLKTTSAQVVAISDEDLESYASKMPNTLVRFYSNTELDVSLTDPYEILVEALEEYFTVGTIDAAKSPTAIARYNVTETPMIWAFVDYGQRRYQCPKSYISNFRDIYRWVFRLLVNVTQPGGANDLAAARKLDEVVVVFFTYGPATNHPLYADFVDIAKSWIQDFRFLLVEDVVVAKNLGVTEPLIVMYKKFDEAELRLNLDEGEGHKVVTHQYLEDWMLRHAHPLLVDLDSNFAYAYSKQIRSVFVFYDETLQDHEQVFNMTREAAKQLRGLVQFYIGSAHLSADLARTMGLKLDPPTGIAMKPDYAFDISSLNSKVLDEFCKGVIDGRTS